MKKKSPFFKFLGDLISFGTPQAIVINIFLIFFILSLIPTSTLEHTHSVCIFKNIILPAIYGSNCPTEGLFANCECPGCGLTRASSELLHGNFREAWNYNKLVFPLFISMIIVFIINSIKWVKFYKKNKRLI